MDTDLYRNIIYTMPYKIDISWTIKEKLIESDFVSVHFSGKKPAFPKIRGFLYDLPGQRGKVYIPPDDSGETGRRMLNNYLEKEIGGVRYKVHSIFASEGDFQALSEKLLVSRAMKLRDNGCAGDAAGG